MAEQNSRIAGLLLAAGSSSRLGRPKQLVEIDGVPLVRRAALKALKSRCDRLFVVVAGNRTPVVEAIADLGVEIIDNPGWREGIGSTVRAGIRRISRGAPDYGGVLVMPCDQIKIGVRHLDRLIESFRRHGEIAASEYDDALGAPALFPRRYFEELHRLTGDSGAKILLRKYASRALRIPCPEASVDVDSPADLQTID